MSVLSGQAHVDPLGLFGDGRRKNHKGKHDPSADLGHSDFDGGHYFDFVKEDYGWSNPFNPFSISRHFQPLEKSIDQAIAAADRGDKNAYERAMHRAQDYYVHYNKGFRPIGGPGIVGHLAAGTAPDKDPVAWEHAQTMTIQMNAYYRQVNNLDKEYDKIRINNYTPPNLSWEIAAEFPYKPIVNNKTSISSNISIAGRK